VARAEKIAIVEDIRSNLERAAGVVLTEYQGITAQEMTALRRKVRSAGGKFQVVKNTLFSRAAAGTKAEPLAEQLTGPMAVAYGFGDPVELSRLVVDLSKEYPALKLRRGMIEGEVVDPAEVQRIAQLPARQELLASVVGALQAPIYNLVTTLGGIIRNLVYTLHAIKQQKESG